MASSRDGEIYTMLSSTDSSRDEEIYFPDISYLYDKNTSRKLKLPLHTISDSDESVTSIPVSKHRSRSISPIPTSPLLSFVSHKNTSSSKRSYEANSEDSITSPSFSKNHSRSVSPVDTTGMVPQLQFQEPANGESPNSNKIKYVLKKNSPVLEKTKKQKTNLTRLRGTDKAEKALQKLKERERKQQEKALAKALKDFEKESKRSEKSEECIKLMRLSIDDRLIKESGFECALNILLDAEIPHSFETNHVPLSIIWHRRIVEAAVINNQLERSERHELEYIMLLCIPPALLVDMVYASIQKKKGSAVSEQSLLEYLTNIKAMFPKMEITIICVGLPNFLKNKKGSVKTDNEDIPSVKPKLKNISKKDIQEVIIEVQLQMFLNYRSLENFLEFGNLLMKYTKAIAEAPLKKEKYQQLQQFSWYAQADSSCPVKIGKDGVGFVDLWQQQIQQFNLITKDVAQAIVSKYPSPSLLIEAYEKCESTKEAEKLLQDIVVRRDYGPLGTTRRVGPQLSYKMYRFFTSTNANELLCR